MVNAHKTEMDDVLNIVIARLAQFHSTLSPEQKEKLVEYVKDKEKRHYRCPFRLLMQYGVRFFGTGAAPLLLECTLKKTTLMIDDDEKLNRLLKDYLGNQGYLVLTATHPDDGLKKLKSQSPHLIILDVMLPDMNGFEVCKIIRRSSTVPILMLTARGEVTDKVVGLELGADDYLAKPFEPRELVARIQSILRRAQQTIISAKRRFGSLVIDFQKRICLSRK